MSLISNNLVHTGTLLIFRLVNIPHKSINFILICTVIRKDLEIKVAFNSKSVTAPPQPYPIEHQVIKMRTSACLLTL